MSNASSPERKREAEQEHAATPAMIRSAEALRKASGVTYPWALSAMRPMLTAALDDPDMGPRISTWRRPCDHSRVLNPREAHDGEPAEYEQGCSPCVRDRMRAYFLGES